MNKKAAAGEAAKSMGVSTRSVETAINVRRNAAEEVIDAIDSGEITVHAASKLIENVPDKEKQKEPGGIGARLRRADSATRGTRSPSFGSLRLFIS
ncbi:hypothetical protein [Rhodopirellula baltica]